VNETYVRQQVFRLARSLGYWPITQTDAAKCPKCGALLRPPVGRPDMLWLHPSAPARVCEVKVLRQKETSLPLSRITEEQRKWLDRWTGDGGVGYIALGVIRQAGSRHRLARLYLVNWPAWLEAERLVRPIQGSIPLEAGPGFARALQEGQLDIVHLLQPFELTRSDGCWRLPEGHSA